MMGVYRRGRGDGYRAVYFRMHDDTIVTKSEAWMLPRVTMVTEQMGYENKKFSIVYFSDSSGKSWESVQLKCEISNEDLYSILNRHQTKEEAWLWLRSATQEDLDLVIFDRVVSGIDKA